MAISARVILLLAGVVALVLPALAAHAVDTVSAEGGVAAGRDIRDSTINISNTTPEQIRDLAREVVREESAAFAKVEELSRQLDVTNEAVVGFLRILNVREVPLEKLTQTLAEIAQRHRQMLDRLAVLNPEDPAVKALIEQARAAIQEADYDRADQLLSEAEAADLAAARMAKELARQAEEAAERRFLNAAATRAERGELSLTRLSYLEAAEHFKAASASVPASNHGVRGAYLRRYADALQQYGYEKGDNATLLQAIGVYRRALEDLPRERVPLDWAMTQNNLGNALQSLGEREAGTGRLEEAVGAFREALKERTRERVPLDWATIQNNLGNALSTLGERAADTARLEEAVGAFREALKEFTRERVPLDWARTQNNLGTTLGSLGAREAGTGRLEEAVGAFREALKERTRERVPLDWATTQNNLGNALWSLGEREAGTGRLEEAVGAFREALKEWTRERVPLDWARTQNNLGSALWALGKRENNLERLKEAKTAIQSAYAVVKEAGYSHYDAYFEKRLHALEQLIQAPQ